MDKIAHHFNAGASEPHKHAAKFFRPSVPLRRVQKEFRLGEAVHVEPREVVVGHDEYRFAWRGDRRQGRSGDRRYSSRQEAAPAKRQGFE